MQNESSDEQTIRNIHRLSLWNLDCNFPSGDEEGEGGGRIVRENVTTSGAVF